jgi:hypothetical protein
MLTIYKRHQWTCPNRSEFAIRVHLVNDIFIRKGRSKRHCTLWVDGQFRGRKICESLKTRDWERAADLIRTQESLKKESKNVRRRITIQQAAENFRADAKSRQLAECTIYEYRLLFKQIETFANRKGLRFPKELKLETLDEFRCEWKDELVQVRKNSSACARSCIIASVESGLTTTPPLTSKLKSSHSPNSFLHQGGDDQNSCRIRPVCKACWPLQCAKTESLCSGTSVLGNANWRHGQV